MSVISRIGVDHSQECIYPFPEMDISGFGGNSFTCPIQRWTRNVGSYWCWASVASRACLESASQDVLGNRKLHYLRSRPFQQCALKGEGYVSIKKDFRVDTRTIVEHDPFSPHPFRDSPQLYCSQVRRTSGARLEHAANTYGTRFRRT